LSSDHGQPRFGPGPAEGRRAVSRHGAALLASAAFFGFGPSANAKCTIAKMLDIPVTMIGLRPTVTAKINGADARFIIDSGAFFSVLTPAAAKDFGLHTSIEPRVTSMRGIGGDFAVSVTTVSEFTLVNIPIRKIQFLVGGSEVGQEVAGVIGQNILHLGDVEYDLANGVVRLMKTDDCDKTLLAYWRQPSQDYSVLEIESSSRSSPHTRAKALLNGVKIDVIFDTGAGTSVLSRRAAERAGVKLQGQEVEFAGFGSGFGEHEVKSWIARFASLKLGDEEIKNTKIHVSDIGDFTDMLVGADFFISHRVFVSNKQRRMYFTYNGGPVFNLAQPLKAAAETAEQAPSESKEAEPADAAAYSRRGMALVARREYARAVEYLERACELAPTEATYFYQRGMAHWYNEQPILAMGDFDQALKLRPEDPETVVSRAQLRQGAGDKHGALEDIAVADRVLPKDADLRLALGHVHENADRYPDAIAQYSLWIDSHGHDAKRADALNNRCWARALWGQELDAALEDCSAAVKLNRERPEILDSRGLVYLRMGNYAKAITDYDAALKLNPNIPWSLYGRGLAKLKLGKKDEGEADVAAAIARSPQIEKLATSHGIQP
jgi:tetratricopeptide (TPR) repeat protein/predicted aspartyl protease